jgi:hypothetical protein
VGESGNDKNHKKQITNAKKKSQMAKKKITKNKGHKSRNSEISKT